MRSPAPIIWPPSHHSPFLRVGTPGGSACAGAWVMRLELPQWESCFSLSMSSWIWIVSRGGASAWSGVVLIGLGVWGLRQASSKWVHSHRHEHDEGSHAHIHFHRPGQAPESPTAHEHSHTAFAVGLLHGFAGTTHLFGLIPALALPTHLAAVYLGSYGIGNLLAMGGFAWLVSWAAARLGDSGVRAYRFVLGAFSAVAIGVGVAWLVI